MSGFMKTVGHYVSPQTWHNSSVTLMYKANFREGNAIINKGAKIGANLLVATTGVVMTGTKAAKTLVSAATLVTSPAVATVKYFKPGSLEFMPTFSSTYSTLKKTINQALGVLISLGVTFAEIAFVGRATTWNLDFQFNSGNSNVQEKLFGKEFPANPNPKRKIGEDQNNQQPVDDAQVDGNSQDNDEPWATNSDTFGYQTVFLNNVNGRDFTDIPVNETMFFSGLMEAVSDN